MEQKSAGNKLSDEKYEQPRIMIIFHPGKDIKSSIIKRKIKEIDPKEVKIQLFLGKERATGTLISPFGVFSGKDHIESSLGALKYIVK